MRSPPKRRRRRQRPSLTLTDDLIFEILVRLPAKSVGRFRCVSKRWLSDLTDPNFILAHSSCSPTSGLFLSTSTFGRAVHIPFDSESRLPDPTLSFLDNNGHPPQFLDCCNGLILCRKPYRGEDIYALAVCNPLTRACHFIPVPDRVYPNEAFLAFDPSVSPHFKVVAVRGGVAAKRGNTFIYSSETRRWKLPTKNLRIDYNSICFGGSKLWNGFLVWNNFKDSFLCLDMSRQQLKWLPRPVSGKELWCRYLGESGGRLHFIGKPVTATSESVAHFDIWELMAGSTEWSVLYEVDIEHIKDVYPEVNAHPEDQPSHKLPIEIVHFSRDEGGVGDRLLLSIPGKIVYYHLRDKSFTTVCNGPPFEEYRAVNSRQPFYHLAQTLSPLYDNVNAPALHEDRICWPPDDALVTRSGRRYPRRMNHATMWFEK